MRYTNYKLLLRLPLAQASGRLRWTRRAIMQGSCLIVGCFCMFTLLNYAWYLPGEGGTLDQEQDDIPDPSLDTVYLPFKPAPYLAATSTSLKPTLPLSARCIDAHLARGELCSHPHPPSLDAVWTWVNGSDILLQDAKARTEASFSEDDPYRPSKSWRVARQFRDHDELRHSMRSVLAYFRPHAGNFHLLASDFRMPPLDPNSTVEEGPWRLGQVPQWLDTKQSIQAWADDHVQLSVTHHANLFSPYKDTIFNSYAIESQFGRLDYVSENFIYMNDDFFFLNPLTPKTFYTSPYGLVFRMQSDLLVSPNPYGNNVRGEWRNLAASNGMLSQRFGTRSRPYVTHEAKSASSAIFHEISQIWTAQITSAATHPFRETADGESDFSMMYLMVHFVVERWREALLWSWVIAKHGSLDDSWGATQIKAAWGELGGDVNNITQRVLVHAGYRDSLEHDRINENLKASGYLQDDPSVYTFTSQDGYPYVSFVDRYKNTWPKFGRDLAERQLPQCAIDYNDCFTEHDIPYNRTTDTFKNIAFRKPHCGDCIILSLLKASGNLGLSAFLPSSDRTISSLAGKAASHDDVPHLPLVQHWEDGEFALQDVMASSRSVSVREWTLQLLQRYRFTIAETPSHFAMLTGPSDARSMIRRLEQERNVALLCINDDIAIGHDEASAILKQWEEEKWPTPAAWEI